MLERLIRRWRRRAAGSAGVLADDGSLVVVGESWDPAAADSAVVAGMRERGLGLEEPLLVRHHLLLPGAPALEQARRLVAGDGYTVRAEPRGSAGPAGSRDSAGLAEACRSAAAPGADDLGWAVRVSRAQLVTGLSLAQERSRMAGLAQRLGGDAVGWDVLAPPPAGPDRHG